MVSRVYWTPKKIEKLVLMREQGLGFLDISLKMSALYNEKITEWLVTKEYKAYVRRKNIELNGFDYAEEKSTKTIFKDKDNPKYNINRACWLHLCDLFYAHPELRPIMTFNKRKNTREVFHA